MTATFIENALTILGEAQDTWTTLHGKVQRIGLLADNNISVDPRYRIFYFDSDSEMLYITYYDGNMIRYNDGDEIPENYNIVYVNEKPYLNKISQNSVACSLGGSLYRIHAAISYDKIVAFYYPNVSAEKFIEDIKNNY